MDAGTVVYLLAKPGWIHTYCKGFRPKLPLLYTTQPGTYRRPARTEQLLSETFTHPGDHPVNPPE